ncbi:hypothetical protein [Streptomyces aurantiogriseus]|uniref:Uncharacterized protein n=1 Tax=Streptomyces aurantiogriseus TaxID=66870 RepID=A0A918FPR9_9ACTN|nr:hypothetical protein [Streptomyces aurantiogriseus]GGR65504.1 hypothetical protein GCM10010251_97340 [Streptomyces aurantiogriseus]
MSEISASELLAAFESDFEAGIQAQNALLSGARFEVWLQPLPASRLLGVCQRRVRTLQRRGKPVVGAMECLASLAEMGERGLLVAYVDDRKRAGHYFRLYLDPHPLKVVGCIGVDISPEDDPVTGPA